MTRLAAVILAGGRSSRMGHDKALISVGAERLIQRTCRVALSCADPVYVVTAWPDRYRSLVPEAVTFRQEQVSQSGAAQGPLTALVQMLSQLQGTHGPEWVLLLACDMPNLSAAVLQRWQTALVGLEPGTLAYVPRQQGRWEPLCGFYRVSAWPELQRWVTAGERGFQPWLNQHAVTPIALADPDRSMLANLNTPLDLARWQTTADLG